MVNSKNFLNTKVVKSATKENRRQVDGIIKRKNILKTENTVKNLPSPIKVDSSVDDNKRMFLKVAGAAGLGLAASALFPKGAEAYVAGSTPTSNVVGVKNIANTKINPATEDTLNTRATEATLGSIKTQADKFTFDGSNNLLTKGTVSVSNIANAQINPATEESLVNVGQSVNDQSIWMLRKILNILKPLGMTTGAGSNRLSVDINSCATHAVTLASLATVSSLTNVVNIGSVNAFSLLKDSARNAYANSIRTKVSF